MITINEIISNSKPHRNKMNEARQTILTDRSVILSIVGGAQGLYGDFENDFELAILDSDSKNFVTKYYVVDSSDDVLPYQTIAQVEEIVNMIFKNGFQVR